MWGNGAAAFTYVTQCAIPGDACRIVFACDPAAMNQAVEMGDTFAAGHGERLRADVPSKQQAEYVNGPPGLDQCLGQTGERRLVAAHELLESSPQAVEGEVV